MLIYNQDFPELLNSQWALKSPKTGQYNCIAWAAGETGNNWWPSPYTVWPKDAPQSETVTAFVNAFETLGYTECKDGTFESGFEKIAIFSKGEDEPTHAARQIDETVWTSKLGNGHDINHELDKVEGPKYGTVSVFMKRPNAP